MASLRLPHADYPWTALVPGAVLVSAGAQVLHLVTVYYLTDKRHKLLRALWRARPPGGAPVAFLIGRLIVASALLNATLWERGRPQEPVEVSNGQP